MVSKKLVGLLGTAVAAAAVLAAAPAGHASAQDGRCGGGKGVQVRYAKATHVYCGTGRLVGFARTVQQVSPFNGATSRTKVVGDRVYVNDEKCFDNVDIEYVDVS